MAEDTLVSQFKRFLVGRPIPTSRAHEERFSRVTGLAILSSDCLSSVAYSVEEVLRVLVVGGLAALTYSPPIAILIATLLIIVTFSYRQTIYAYPGGGGAYIVAHENLGVYAGLVAAASLFIDYTLTVAVSIASGVAALTSALPALAPRRLELALIFVFLLTLGNLRGVRESGRIFAVPTYVFAVSLLALLATGLWRAMTGTLQPVVQIAPLHVAGGTLTIFALLTAFSNGCSAMTGVEAISNAVPGFRPPETKHASQTLITMALLAVTLIVGLGVMTSMYHVVPAAHETVLSQLARGIFSGRGLLYYIVQGATMLILVLAANTAYAGFPRLASIVARDRFLPRQFMNQGDRLAFSNGILVLTFFAAVLLIIFHADTHRLIPLYMIGVFLSFTLSQTGMVLRWRRLRTSGWRSSAFVNGLGAIVTAGVLLVVTITKTPEGAWIILMLIPALVVIFIETRHHYDHVASQLTLRGWEPDPKRKNTVLIPIGGLHRAVVQALRYARTLSTDVRAVYVSTNAEATETVRRDWELWGQGVPLVVLDSPYRSLMEPLLDYIRHIDAETPDDYVTVILPEFVPARWWQQLLHNQNALLIKAALLFRPNTIVTSVPFHLRN
ncbi:MAG TPA: APC family permease [Vicinamibacterales bacterium]